VSALPADPTALGPHLVVSGAVQVVGDAGGATIVATDGYGVVGGCGGLLGRRRCLPGRERRAGGAETTVTTGGCTTTGGAGGPATD
jgi:hypothetical protein